MDISSGLRVDVVIELVNEYSTIARNAAGESHVPPRLPRDMARFTVPAAEFTRISDVLYPVFSARSQSASIVILNAILLGELCIPQLDPDLPSSPLRWRAGGSGRAGLLGLCGVGLLEAANSGHRFGLCTATGCADVYVDSGRGRTRRFCSVLCQNRTQVAQFRARQSSH